MPQTASVLGFTPAAFEAFLASRQEPRWVGDLRQSAWKSFEELRLPSRHEEEWMRTDIRTFKLDRFGLPGEPTTDVVAPAALLTAGVDLAGRTAVLNGVHLETRLDDDLARRGVLFGSLDALVAEHGENLRPHLFQVVNSRADKFAALHAACWTGGTLLYVPRGVRIERPLHMFSALAGGVDLGHALIVLEEGSEATLLAETAGDEQTALHCGAIEVVVGKEARLRYVN